MAQPPTRNILAIILRNFINSFKPRQISGTLVGTDYFGNKYYEIPAKPSVGKDKRNRWFEPVGKDDFDQEMPAEWESWLRGRRAVPPTDEEIKKNYAIMEMKKRNAIAVEAKAGKMTPMLKGLETFPKHDEYEIMPGKQQNSNK